MLISESFFETMSGELLMTFLVAMAPVIELRGAIPAGISVGPPPALACAAAPGQRDGFGYFVGFDGDWNLLPGDGRPHSSRYTLRAQAVDSGVDGLGKAQVEAFVWESGTMESLFSLEVAWQEVSP